MYTEIIYAILWLLSSFLWLSVDRRYGVTLYQPFDRWTSPEGKAPENKGFVVGQNAKFRFGVSIAIAVIQTYFFYHGAPLIEKFVTFIAMIIVIFIGFYLGPWALGLWKGTNKVFDIVDKVEDGTIDIKGEAHKYIDGATGQIAKTVHELSDEAGEQIAKKVHELSDGAGELFTEAAHHFKEEKKPEPEPETKKEAVIKSEEPKKTMADFVEDHWKQK